MSRTVEVIVTRLERAAPAGITPPQPAGFRLALMRAEHIPLHFYRYLYGTVGRPWLWLERAGLDDAALAGRVHKEGVEVWVLYGNGSPAAFFELDFGADAVTLVYFGLFPEWIGRRIGPWLLSNAIQEGFSRGAPLMRVSTCTLDHPAALAMYQRLGFVPVSRERTTLVLSEEMAEHAAALPPP